MGGTPVTRRWLAFNAVGLIGAAVQITVLAALTHGANLNYLAATALAVETAVLHNFVWHQRWTWRDRRPSSNREVFTRLVRFHLLNGSVSLGGNLVITALLTAVSGLDPVPANLTAIIACSLVNFAGSNVLVFSPTGLPHRASSALLVVALVAYPETSTVSAADAPPELKAETLAAWTAYQQRVDERYFRETSGGEFFLEDQQPGSPGSRQLARDGQVTMIRVPAASPGYPEPSVPDGRIHHWAG